jgi:hypothetical protein
MEEGDLMVPSRLLAVLGVLSLLAPADARAGWVRSYGKLASPSSASIATLPGGGAVLLARGLQDVLLRIDDTGEVIAAREVPWQPSVLATGPAGEIFVGSWATSTDERVVPWVARLDGNLATQWGRRLRSPPGSPILVIRSAVGARDGGLLLGGSQGDASYVLKLTATGEIEWKTRIDPSDEDMMEAVQPAADGGAISAGRSRGGPWLVRLDRNGALVWHRTYPAWGELADLVPTSDGGLMATGRHRGSALLLKVDAGGKAQWQLAIAGLQEGRALEALGGGRALLAGLDEAGSNVFLEIGANGAAGWRRRVEPGPGMTIQAAEPESLAIASGLVYFAPAVTGRLEVVHALTFRVGEGAGPWLAEAAEVSAVPVALAAEELSVEADALPLRLEMAALALPPVSVSSRDATSGPPAARPEEPAAFRGRLEERERAVRYRRLLAAKELDLLDELVAGFRRDRTHEDPMRWELGIFYDALADDDTVPEAERLARLRAWVQARPRSTAAKIALAEALNRAGWLRRGSGYSDAVTDKGWAELARFTAEARRVLEGVGAAGEDDARYWELRVVLAEPEERNVLAIARRAAARGHHDPAFYRRAGAYLHAKWGGSAAAYRAYTEEVTKLTAPTFGEGMYAWLAHQASLNVVAKEFAEDYAFDWERMKRGFEDIIALAPDWLPSHHRYALMASRVQDRQTARALFQRRELGWYPGAEAMWRHRSNYESIREWALRVPVEPFVESTRPPIAPAPAQPAPRRAEPPVARPAPQVPTPSAAPGWPPIVLQGELVSGSSVQRLCAFFVRAADAIAAVSAVPPDPNRRDDVNAIRTAWRRTTSWKVWAPGKPEQVMTVASIATLGPKNPQLGVAITLQPVGANPPVHVLKPVPPSVNVGTLRQLYVVGCRWTAGRCEQIVAEARLVGRHEGATHDGTTYRSFEVGLDEAYDADAFLGGPVLDEDGQVLGVASGPSSSFHRDFAQVLGADYLTTVLPAPGGSGGAQ